MEGWAIEGLNKKRLDSDNGAKYKGWFRSWIEIIGIERRLGWIRSEWIYRVLWGECEERLRYVKRDLVHASYPGIKSVRRPSSQLVCRYHTITVNFGSFCGIIRLHLPINSRSKITMYFFQFIYRFWTYMNTTGVTNLVWWSLSKNHLRETSFIFLYNKRERIYEFFPSTNIYIQTILIEKKENTVDVR